MLIGKVRFTYTPTGLLFTVSGSDLKLDGWRHPQMAKDTPFTHKEKPIKKPKKGK